ncbi:DNA-directed RNA polymerase subunit beta [Gemmata obscuriglobus]|uniref:DNA-directed RNA polymerase subunit beta n=1 Tax=Gemmata obscuriglobus TaxID=114 RepID=A0A2Z3GYU3_9BACT|nr:DNA-directed RNA polymerase subunit beta [Gemmata obscuriglobus]AWM36657.1 DNA-directed RNA polymerase subunit beta [Gemmata obscuriglobus]QEG30702.1 DNA-directed RNA polymerase subunit beta [Gemmata obscuriglobus]VTS10029.1 dna-directed rna polymerase subunit beta : DNA-directed RNA polymerase subunit beta OS=Singulisphaera acidiphila (strain ATCC BAA-1392 / DSM 18658 / VKM B-2454 / MOB10) GN=rpoB PE=3 SV=1: RNA_pol_Rpb2_1: RNA_pol_Rpb2_2: RNA_pol_Rpb2_3: RNA_pol_Rpb2_45: RNA_pol_Rpb2_6: RNA
MPIPAQRIIVPTVNRDFGRFGDAVEVPDLTDVQTRSYDRFLQLDASYDKRTQTGLEGVLQEIFPIESYDKRIKLEYLRYELGKPRYDPDECRQLRLTYGRPFRVWLRLRKTEGEPVEEEVYLGDMPIMIGGGEFIINGAERVVVSQLHRSPGVDFVVTREADKDLHSCRIIPERGSWIEINATKKDTLGVRIDQSGKFSAVTLLRAMDPMYSTTESILKEFFGEVIEQVNVSVAGSRLKLVGDPEANQMPCIAVEDVIDPETGEVYLDAGKPFTSDKYDRVASSMIKTVQVMAYPKDPIILNAIHEDVGTAGDSKDSHEGALLKIYQRLRPGNPPQLEKAKELFKEKFLDPNRYRLGRVGRFRINRKFNQTVAETEMTLRSVDFVNSVKYLLDLRAGKGHVDDIDHLGNRRLRTIDELAADELRKGFLKLRRTVQERMAIRDQQDMNPRTLINPKSVSAAIEYFFGRSELSQVVDQTNPLAQLTHERRLSALGPGGLNRKRAGFEVRDVHISHYGRICPIETPEGTNIGLISSLSIYSEIDEYGFLITPYKKVSNKNLTEEVVRLRADEESNAVLVPADTPFEGNKIATANVSGRQSGELMLIPAEKVQYIDVSPKQMVGVSAGLIPFLEHDDANRALMGSNMQRQAVPLLIPEPPLVGTGLEKDVAKHSGMLVRAQEEGTVVFVDAERIRLEEKDKIVREYVLRKYHGLNERTCLNQKPIVRMGQKVKKGEIIADGAATKNGELALGRNVLVAFMSWEGYNFEDAIIISERLVKNDTYTSIHIEEFDIEIRETKLGKEEFTRDIPNVSPKALANLDEHGVVQIGTYVRPGDILVGKVSPKSRSELTPEEKLLHAIFGRAGEDVKNDSLEVQSGTEGIVIAAHRFSRRAHMSEDEKKQIDKDRKDIESTYNRRIAEQFREFVKALEDVLDKKELKDPNTGKQLASDKDDKVVAEQAKEFKLDKLDIRSPDSLKKAQKIHHRHWERIQFFIDEQERKLNSLNRGDELPSGVQQMVKVYVATKRVISVGDKMAGRHGNKGVISKVLPEEDMPFLKDGTPVDILLNPLGVPSRMNVGQILETHLGYAAAKLGFKAVTPVFDGATEEEIRDALKEAGIPETGKSVLYDGRTGDAFDQPVTVGYIYMLKLHHLVDDKVHARATGPYSLITQQPLGGKARFGGQRFGEMEVWALEAYGAAYILQELLTVKSDDVEGRTKIYESMVKGENTLEAGTPASFDVLTHEIRGLGLNMCLEKKRV